MAAKVHDSSAEPVGAASEVVAPLPETWASTRPLPPAIRYALLGSTGAAGAAESMVTLTYWPDAPPEQPNAQYERKDLPTIAELVRLAPSRNQRYQDAVW